MSLKPLGEMARATGEKGSKALNNGIFGASLISLAGGVITFGIGTMLEANGIPLNVLSSEAALGIFLTCIAGLTPSDNDDHHVITAMSSAFMGIVCSILVADTNQNAVTYAATMAPLAGVSGLVASVFMGRNVQPIINGLRDRTEEYVREQKERINVFLFGN